MTPERATAQLNFLVEVHAAAFNQLGLEPPHLAPTHVLVPEHQLHGVQEKELRGRILKRVSLRHQMILLFLHRQQKLSSFTYDIDFDFFEVLKVKSVGDGLVHVQGVPVERFGQRILGVNTFAGNLS